MAATPAPEPRILLMNPAKLIGRCTGARGTGHLAINNTLLRRLLVRLALKTTARFYKRSSCCVPISRNLIVKTGFDVHLTEGVTMAFVGEHTSIPVSRVYCSFLHKDRAYIVMERIRGETAAVAWRTNSQEEKVKILGQLRNMMKVLRALRPPEGAGISSCVGGSLCDLRIPRKDPRFGPFETTQEFHSWLREDFDPAAHPERVEDDDWRDIRDMVAKQDGPWPPPVFTHCDLNPFNIMVRDGEIVGIIDWEFSGWYPLYWEYTWAFCGNIIRTGWRDQVVPTLDPYPEELKMEITRHKWWGEW